MLDLRELKEPEDVRAPPGRRKNYMEEEVEEDLQRPQCETRRIDAFLKQSASQAYDEDFTPPRALAL